MREGQRERFKAEGYNSKLFPLHRQQRYRYNTFIDKIHIIFYIQIQAVPAE